MENVLKNSNLPERCYGILPSTGDAIIIKRGETGYYRTFLSDDKEFNRQLVDEYNEILGVSKAQAAAMLAGSMFGWHVPAADPNNYDENGHMKKMPLSEKITVAAEASNHSFSKTSKDIPQVEHENAR